jgi:hypothetical protein
VIGATGCPHIDAMPRYKGLPRLYTAIEVQGIVDFATTDVERWVECLRNHLCGVCGKPLEGDRFYAIGGPESGAQRAFFDPPMHNDCAKWSFENCPYLTGRTDYISEDRIALKEQRLNRQGGIKVASADVADAPEVSIYSGTGYSFPHRTPTGYCWVIESGFAVERTQSRRST